MTRENITALATLIKKEHRELLSINRIFVAQRGRIVKRITGSYIRGVGILELETVSFSSARTCGNERKMEFELMPVLYPASCEAFHAHSSLGGMFEFPSLSPL